MRAGHGYAKSGAMPTDPALPKPAAKHAGGNQIREQRPLPPAARRALAEAAARRVERERDRKPPDPPQEVYGRGGLDPTRYGDWEINGLTSDF